MATERKLDQYDEYVKKNHLDESPAKRAARRLIIDTTRVGELGYGINLVQGREGAKSENEIRRAEANSVEMKIPELEPEHRTEQAK